MISRRNLRPKYLLNIWKQASGASICPLARKTGYLAASFGWSLPGSGGRSGAIVMSSNFPPGGFSTETAGSVVPFNESVSGWGSGGSRKPTKRAPTRPSTLKDLAAFSTEKRLPVGKSPKTPLLTSQIRSASSSLARS